MDRPTRGMSGRTKNSTIAANIARQQAFRSPTLENLLTEPGVQPANPKERRDIRRVLEHWVQHASSDDGIPALDNFDFASIKRDWSHRFLICTDQNAEDAAFLAYGPTFAAQLGLPETVTAIVPLNAQLPERYRSLFAEGCENAMTERLPARFSGAIEHYFTVELFRAVFLPIRLHPSWSKWLIFGSFNCRTVLATDQRGS